MFKKKCSKCSKKVDHAFDFCPYCGVPMKENEDYGLLGKSDEIGEINNLMNRGLNENQSNSIFEKMIGSAMKMIERELQKTTQEQAKSLSERRSPINPNMNDNFELFINGKKVKLPGEIAGIQIEEIPKNQNIKKEQTMKVPKISEEFLKRAAKLPRKEAKTKLTRTADKIVYELDTPGLESINNILVNKLEDSIEVKAYTQKAVYFKTIQIKLPLIKYAIKEDKLFLEFKTQ